MLDNNNFKLDQPQVEPGRALFLETMSTANAATRSPDAKYATMRHPATEAQYFDVPPLDYLSNNTGAAENSLLETARHLLNHDLAKAPVGSHIGAIPKRFGCAASISNVLIADHLIGKNEFNLNVDGLESVIAAHGGTRVEKSDLQKGDIVVGRDQIDGSGGRHMGIVDMGADGQLQVLNNAGGRFVSNNLPHRFFEQFHDVYGWRLAN